MHDGFPFGGVVGGEGGVVVESDTVVVERDKPLPMFPLSQVYPTYPEEARLRAWEDQLVVRYVIGKNGRVKEVTVISAPERPVFIDVTLKAIKNWRFRPMIKDGERQEVVHELVHTVVHNHSKQFWQRVATIMPDYHQHRRWLREHGRELLV